MVRDTLSRVGVPGSESHLCLHVDLICLPLFPRLEHSKGDFRAFTAVSNLSRCCPGDLAQVPDGVGMLRPNIRHRVSQCHGI